MAELPVNLSDIQAAGERIAEDVFQTPLIHAHPLEEFSELLLAKKAALYLKAENFQVTRSFKTRGAFNALRQLSNSDSKLGVVARSSGNFAQALAYAAFKLGIQATIVMPENAPAVKKEKTASYSPEIVFYEGDGPAGDALAAEISTETGKVLLSPYDNRDVIAGQGTAALEIVEQLPEVSTFLCQIGGGGLLSGCATAIKSMRPSCRVIGIEPQGANDYFLSRQAGKQIRLDSTNTIADGLRSLTVGDLNWPLLGEYVDEVLTVSEDEIISTMKFLREAMGLIVEPSGAVSLAGLLYGSAQIAGDKIVCLISGANVDLGAFCGWACPPR